MLKYPHHIRLAAMSEKRDPEETIEMLQDTHDEIDANGLDSRASELEDAVEFYDELVEQEVPDAPEEDVQEEKENAIEIRDTLQRIADGEADESDVETAQEAIEATLTQMAIIAIEATAGNL